MPLDSGNTEKRTPDFFDRDKTIYVCEDGSVRVETRTERKTFSAEEFVSLLRKIIMRKQGSIKKRSLPVLMSRSGTPKICGLMMLLIVASLFFAACGGQQQSSVIGAGQRIVGVGGTVTETIFALGAEDKLVGVDTSSIYPEAATKMPQVGYQRTLSAEGVLSLKPDLVLAMAEAGPPPAIQQIEAANVKIEKISGENSVEGAKAKIRQIAQAVDRTAKGEELVKKLDADLSEAAACTNALKSKPKILFIYARGTGAPNVSGTNTTADAMIRLAGGQNAVTEFENFKPLTPEALVSAQPDYILLPTLGLQSIGGIDGLSKIPGVADTPAGKNRRIITVDDLVLLGFGPRLGEGIKELCGKIQ